MKKNSLLLLCCLLIGSLQAQFISTYSTGVDHNHFSIEKLDNHVITGGTVYEPGSLTDTDLHFQRMDAGGNIVWEATHDIGTAERCFDISMQGNDVILATGSVFYDGQTRAYLMRIDPNSGALVDYTVLMHDINTVRPEQMGIAVEYAPSVDQYYIVGQAANWLDPHDDVFPGTSYPTKNAAGLIICIDNQLNAIWTQEVARPGTHSGSLMGQNWHFNAFNSVIDNPGVGIFISGLQGTANVARLLDYSGANIWDITDSYTGTIVASHAMCFDQNNDRLLIAGHNGGTSGIMEILNASSGGAFLTRFADFTDTYYTNAMILRPTDMELDPNTGQLWMHADMLQYTLANWREIEKPCLINIDLNSLHAQYAVVPELFAVRHNTMDHEYISYNYQNPSTVRSEKLVITDNGPVFIGYSRSAMNTYDLNVMYADVVGSVDEGCQEVYFFGTDEDPRVQRTPTDIPFLLTHDVIPETSQQFNLNHGMNRGCYKPLPCGVTVNSLSRIDYDCYAYTYNVSLTLAPGAIAYEYDWDFGDGTTATTTVPTASHDYGITNPKCSYTVCVTVKAQGSDGSLCTDNYCQFFFSFNGGGTGCPGCTNKRGDEGFASDGSDMEELSVMVVGNQVQVTGFEQAYDLTIMDMNGRVIRTVNQRIETSITVPEMTAGIFLIQVVDNAGNVSNAKAFIH